MCERGRLITPAAYVYKAGEFTKEALNQLGAKNGAYVDIPMDGYYAVTEEDYIFAASLKSFSATTMKKNPEFAAVLYATVTTPEGHDFTLYGGFNPAATYGVMDAADSLKNSDSLSSLQKEWLSNLLDAFDQTGASLNQDGIFLNVDINTVTFPFLQAVVADGVVTEDELKTFFTQYKDTQITDLAFDVFCQSSMTPSDVWTDVIDIYNRTEENGWMLGASYGHQKICYNYAVEEVRQWMLDYIEEQIMRYDVDGLELDFSREWFCFPYLDYINAGSTEHVEIMNDFIRDVNALVEAAEAKWGHDMKIKIKLYNYFSNPNTPSSVNTKLYSTAGSLKTLAGVSRRAVVAYHDVTPYGYTQYKPLPARYAKQLKQSILLSTAKADLTVTHMELVFGNSSVPTELNLTADAAVFAEDRWVLTNRWDFTEDLTDSIGGATVTPVAAYKNQPTYVGGHIILDGSNAYTLDEVIQYAATDNFKVVVKGKFDFNTANGGAKRIFGSPSGANSGINYIDLNTAEYGNGYAVSFSPVTNAWNSYVLKPDKSQYDITDGEHTLEFLQFEGYLYVYMDGELVYSKTNGSYDFIFSELFGCSYGGATTAYNVIGEVDYLRIATLTEP